MYVCIYLCVYVCMYVYIYVCMYVYIYVCMYVCIYVCCALYALYALYPYLSILMSIIFLYSHVPMFPCSHRRKAQPSTKTRCGRTEKTESSASLPTAHPSRTTSCPPCLPAGRLPAGRLPAVVPVVTERVGRGWRVGAVGTVGRAGRTYSPYPAP
jgi:hypothetical protein